MPDARRRKFRRLCAPASCPSSRKAARSASARPPPRKPPQKKEPSRLLRRLARKLPRKPRKKSWRKQASPPLLRNPLPPDKGGAPGEPTADRGETDQIARFDLALTYRSIQRERQRRRGGVPVPFDQTERARRWDAKQIPHLLQQPPVGLMKEEAGDIGNGAPMFLQGLLHGRLQTAHRHAKQAGAPHVDRMESFGHCLLRRRHPRAARADLDQLRMGAIRPQRDRQDPMALITRHQDRSPRPVPEEDRRARLLIIEEARLHFCRGDQDPTGLALPDQMIPDRQRVEKP